jgi:hypothetical protein
MIDPSRCFVRALVGLLLGIALLDSGVRGDEPNLDTLGRHFRARGTQLQEVFVHWRTHLEVFMPASGTYVNYECRAAVKGEKRSYDLKVHPVSGRPMSKRDLRRAMSYDGSETRILLGTDNGRIFPGDEQRQFDAPDEFLALQGYPKSPFRIWAEDTPLSCDVAARIEKGEYRLAGVQQVTGVACTKLAAAHDEICIDPNRGWAIVQREVLDPRSGKPLSRYVFRDFGEVQPGVWLAREIMSESFVGTQLKSRRRLEVVELKVKDVPDDLFSLRFEPGVFVSDMRHTTKDAEGKWPIVNYAVPAKPEDLDAVVAAAVKRQRGDELKSAPISLQRGVLLIANALLVVLLLLVALKAGRRMRRSSS